MYEGVAKVPDAASNRSIRLGGLLIAGGVLGGLLLLAPVGAQASFVALTGEASSCTGNICKLFLNEAKDVTIGGTGNVGHNNTGPLVTIDTTGATDISGATIKPVKGGTLTDLVFTPANDLLFGDFTFTGQLMNTGDISITVTDQTGTVLSPITFTNVSGTGQFDRIGVISQGGESIKSVAVSSDGFTSFDHVEFSPVPVPPAIALFGSGLVGLMFLSQHRRKKQATCNLSDQLE